MRQTSSLLSFPLILLKVYYRSFVQIIFLLLSSKEYFTEMSDQLDFSDRKLNYFHLYCFLRLVFHFFIKNIWERIQKLLKTIKSFQNCFPLNLFKRWANDLENWIFFFFFFNFAFSVHPLHIGLVVYREGWDEKVGGWFMPDWWWKLVCSATPHN